ncbi:ankyrin repeat domain-containing protein [Solirubrobacter phytolaccae]|uniref:Ankyrin repeat domain-containing protein n=1 Tax=Solirubrobacter phytolaccae TaxID=1404360 RepID=A0A9X3N4I6_9ACTN|nr:ankyrin repeat domain-containing protein [Solirubrobacter phytolaccae]MDA0179356.1 ankyrin repeat domain-containing protein [Solirubrobacter phytolaccae]
MDEWGEDDRVLEAVERGDVAAARTLLEAGANPHFDSWGCSLIGEALDRRDGAMARLLLEFGAVLGEVGEDGRHPIHRAAAAGPDPWVLEFLLELGHDPNVTDQHGWTPLHAAAAYGATRAAERLLAAGADPSAVTHEGKTPADLAAVNGRDWPL